MITDSQMGKWADRVGEVMAHDVAKGRLLASEKGTLPELLLEAGLQERGVNYEAQVEFGFTRADHMIYNADGTATAIFADGNYWHEGSAGHDYGKGLQLVGCEVRGCTVTNVVRVLESDLIEQPDLMIDMAVRGEQYRMMA